MQSSNPVLTRLGQAAQQERAAGTGYGTYPPPPAGYTVPAAPARTMTLDDVVVRTVGLLLLTGIAGAVSWVLVPDGPAVFLAMLGAALASLALGLVITFARITNPVLIGAYAVLQGLMLGVVSRYFETRYGGIVLQAVLGTFAVFAGMATLYKLKILRATPRFAKFVIAGMIGVVLLMFANLIGYALGFDLGLRDNGTGPVNPWAIVFSLVAITFGALTFILDFDAIEQGVRHGLPEKYAWYCAFGLLAGLVFLYWEILRLLSYLRR